MAAGSKSINPVLSAEHWLSSKEGKGKPGLSNLYNNNGETHLWDLVERRCKRRCNCQVAKPTMRARNPMANVRTTPVILMLSLRDNIILRRVVTISYGVLKIVS